MKRTMALVLLFVTVAWGFVFVSPAAAESCGVEIVQSDIAQILNDSQRDIVVDETNQIQKCSVVYRDCETKTIQSVLLNIGETFYYGDWNGSTCVRKNYYCPSALTNLMQLTGCPQGKVETKCTCSSTGKSASTCCETKSGFCNCSDPDNPRITCR